MNIVTFVAATAAEALDQIREQLGPSAVVINVRRLPAQGISRLWKRSGGIEVLACVPDEPGVEPAEPSSAMQEAGPVDHPRLDVTSDDGAIPSPELAAPDMAEPMANNEGGISPSVGGVPGFRSGFAFPPAPSGLPESMTHPDWDPFAGWSGPSDDHPWRSRGLLLRMGLLPIHAERVLDDVRQAHGDTPPELLLEELSLCCSALARHWRKPAPAQEGALRPHVFIGPPGSGKTTALCKWLANAVLLQGRSAKVWRLDAHTANTAELLSVYGEILGVPVERWWSREEALSAELNFVDFTGVDWQDRVAFAEMVARLRELPSPRIHLVLNAAYDTSLLLTQARAFAGLEPEDIICTHLDEETRWGKLWNLVLGTKFTLRFLGAGQNIPGRFISASAEQLFPPAFRRQ